LPALIEVCGPVRTPAFAGALWLGWRIFANTFKKLCKLCHKIELYQIESLENPFLGLASCSVTYKNGRISLKLGIARVLELFITR
jgi:hypothetical protein